MQRIPSPAPRLGLPSVMTGVDMAEKMPYINCIIKDVTDEHGAPICPIVYWRGRLSVFPRPTDGEFPHRSGGKLRTSRLIRRRQAIKSNSCFHPAADGLYVRPLRTVTMIQPGTTVRFAKMPDWVAKLPDESRRVFEFCLGRTYCIDEIDGQGLFVLDVSAEVDGRFGGFMNDIRLEAEYLEEVPCPQNGLIGSP